MDLFLAPQPCLLCHGDLCGLPLARWVHSLPHRACVHLPQLPEPSLCIKGLMCSFSGSSAPLYPVFCVLWRSFYAPLLLAPQAWSMCYGLCALDATPLLTLQAHPLSCRASLGFFLFPEPTVWSESQTMAEKRSFVCFLPSESLLCPAFWDSSAPLWAPLWGNFSVPGELLFQDSLPPLGHKLLSRSSTSFPFLCFHPLSYLISRSLACPPGGLGSSVVA